MTSCNSWAFPTLPSIYVQICNTYQLKESSLPLPRIYWPFHINFSVPKTNLVSKVEMKTSKTGFTPTDQSVHPSIHSFKLCEFCNLNDLLILVDLENLVDMANLVNQVILMYLVILLKLVVLVKLVILVNLVILVTVDFLVNLTNLVNLAIW